MERHDFFGGAGFKSHSGIRDKSLIFCCSHHFFFSFFIHFEYTWSDKTVRCAVLIRKNINNNNTHLFETKKMSA